VFRVNVTLTIYNVHVLHYHISQMAEVIIGEESHFIQTKEPDEVKSDLSMRQTLKICQFGHQSHSEGNFFHTFLES